MIFIPIVEKPAIKNGMRFSGMAMYSNNVTMKPIKNKVLSRLLISFLFIMPFSVLID